MNTNMSGTVTTTQAGSASGLDADPSLGRRSTPRIPRPDQARGAVTLLVGLLTAACAMNGLAASQQEEKAKGEEMLQKAHQDFLQAKHFQETATRMLQTAHKEQEMANQRTQEARTLMREAFLLIRDSNRMRGAQLRAEAETKELQAKSEEAELQHLQASATQERKIAADSAIAAVRIQDAARNESNPAEKAQLTRMAESLTKERATASAELAPIEKRIAIVEAEINRFNAAVKVLTVQAGALDPIKK